MNEDIFDLFEEDNLFEEPRKGKKKTKFQYKKHTPGQKPRKKNSHKKETRLIFFIHFLNWTKKYKYFQIFLSHVVSKTIINSTIESVTLIEKINSVGPH